MTLVRAALALAASLVLAACAKPSGQVDHSAHGEDHAAHGGPAPSVSSASEHAGHAMPPSASARPGPSGYAAFAIDPAKAGYVQLATALVEERDFDRVLRTSGVVAVDETRTAHVHPKVRGFVQTVSADFVGRKVKSGEVLCGIFSQEVFAAEMEFLAILDRTGTPAADSEFAAAERAAQKKLLDAARRRLSLWDVPKAEIDRLESSREARKTFSIHAPRAGVIVTKQAVDGMFVDPSFELFTISDLSRVWVLADLYEGDVAYVRVGDVADLAIESVGTPIKAPVAFLPPTLDEATRTLKARFELDNKAGLLRPGAFVTVSLDAKVGRALAVPEAAVVRTGTRSIVFVVHEIPPGSPKAAGGSVHHVEPREVTLGPLVGDRYQVKSGVVAGEAVSTSAQFLLDSESRIRATSGDAPKGHVH